MTEEQKSKMIAEAESIEAIREFFTEWFTLEQLYEAEARACITVLHLIGKNVLSREDEEELKNLLEQHQLMVERMKPFAPKKEDEL